MERNSLCDRALVRIQPKIEKVSKGAKIRIPMRKRQTHNETPETRANRSPLVARLCLE